MRQLMKLAIANAEQCRWAASEEAWKPKVGAVITIKGNVVASTARGDDDHAEKIALSNVSSADDLSKATVWTTLEPCTHNVRRKSGDSCTERLIRAGVKKVVIGILDPNQDVCGKGLLELQRSGIEVALFPHDLALQIRRLNDKFIQAQQDLGITILSPINHATLTRGYQKIKGRFINRPGPDVIGMTYVDPVHAPGFNGGWWPQDSVMVVPGADREWEVTVHFGANVPHRVCIVKANELGRGMITFFHELKRVRTQVIQNVSRLYNDDQERVRTNLAPWNWPLPMSSLPKGLDLQASIDVEVADAVL